MTKVIQFYQTTISITRTFCKKKNDKKTRKFCCFKLCESFYKHNNPRHAKLHVRHICVQSHIRALRSTRTQFLIKLNLVRYQNVVGHPVRIEFNTTGKWSAKRSCKSSRYNRRSAHTYIYADRHFPSFSLLFHFESILMFPMPAPHEHPHTNQIRI